MKIYLRPVQLSDGANIVKWRNTYKVRNHSFNKEEVTIESNEIFFNNCVKTGKYKQFIAERIDEEFGVASYPIATVYLKDMDLSNKRCELCVFTSDDAEWNNDSQSIAIRLLLEKAFDEYGIHKVYTHVFACNIDEVALMKRAGFKEEALFKEEAIDLQGNPEDIVRLSIIDREYRRLIEEQ